MLICTSVGRCGLSAWAYYRVLLQFLWHILTHSCQAIAICVAVRVEAMYRKLLFIVNHFRKSFTRSRRNTNSFRIINFSSNACVCVWVYKVSGRTKWAKEMCSGEVWSGLWIPDAPIEIVAQNAQSIKIEMNEMCNSLLEWVPIEIRMCVLVQIVLRRRIRLNARCNIVGGVSLCDDMGPSQ